MTSPVAVEREARVAGALAAVVLGGAALRLLLVAVAGIVEWAHVRDFPGGRLKAADVLLVFGEAGDGTEVLLVLVAGAFVWWQWRSGGLPGRSAFSALTGVLSLTAASALAAATGSGLGASTESPVQWSRTILSTGMPVVYAAVAVGGIVAVRGLVAVADQESALAGADGIDALVFVVDRSSGDVRAYFSADEAARRTHVYSVEDDEYEFFTDTGDLLVASVEHGRVMLRRTDTNRYDDLLDRLKAFAARREIHVDVADADDASAYAVPFSDWQFLQMWPGWMRPLGRLFRPR